MDAGVPNSQLLRDAKATVRLHKRSKNGTNADMEKKKRIQDMTTQTGPSLLFTFLPGHISGRLLATSGGDWRSA